MFAASKIRTTLFAQSNFVDTADLSLSPEFLVQMRDCLKACQTSFDNIFMMQQKTDSRGIDHLITRGMPNILEYIRTISPLDLLTWNRGAVSCKDFGEFLKNYFSDNQQEEMASPTDLAKQISEV